MKTYELLGQKKEISYLGLPLPTRWSRDDIKLAILDQPFFVDLGCLRISTESGEREFNAYVARYELAGALVDGNTRANDDDGYFLVFYLAEFLDTKVNVWTFAQTESPVYSDRPEKGDYLLAEKIGKKGGTLTNNLPRWKKSEAIWPTVDGVLMNFAGETDLTNTVVNKKYATVGERIFWFFLISGGCVRLKAVTQPIKFQTADAHYASEIK